MEEARHDVSSKLYGCRLGSKYLSPDADIVSDPSFEVRMFKILNNRIDEMTVAERVSCTTLLVDDADEYQANQVSVTIGKKISSNKRRRLEGRRRSQNCDFIIGSAVQVERLWSKCNSILRDNRKAMTPILFEILIFLKSNKNVRDLSHVSEAMNFCKADHASSVFSLSYTEDSGNCDVLE